MKSRFKMILLVIISTLIIFGCVSPRWRLFRLDSLKADSKGNYDFGQMLYGSVDEVNGWEVQIGIIALVGNWRGDIMKTDKFDVTVRMSRVDSMSLSGFQVENLVITMLPDSTRILLNCSENKIKPGYPNFRYMKFPPVKIPKHIDTILVDFVLKTNDENEKVEILDNYHHRLVRFDKSFKVFAPFAD